MGGADADVPAGTVGEVVTDKGDGKYKAPMAMDELQHYTEKIVDALDKDGDGFMSVDEVKVMVEYITKIPAKYIPDHHPEVVKLANISKEEMCTRLLKMTDEEIIKAAYERLVGRKEEA